MRVLFLVLFVIPLIELYFLIQLGNWIGALPTVILTIFTGVVGVVLMRSQGLATIQQAQIDMQSGHSPQATMMEGVFIFLGGVFLFFPGLISDSIGLLFLIPFVRKALIKQSLKGMSSRGHYRYQKDEAVYEGEWSEKTSQTPKSVEHTVIEGEVIDSDSSKKS